MSRRVAFAALALGVLAHTGFAGDPAGPPIGATKYVTSIAPTNPGETDTDDYTADVGLGETLSVTVAVSKKSTLEPSLIVIGPDGTQYTEASGDILVKAKGRKLVLAKGFIVPMTGLWAARVGGKNASEGEYKATFKVKKAKPSKDKNLTLGAPDLTAVHGFAAVDGGILTLILASKKGGEIVTLRSLTDPFGADVPEPLSPDTTAAGAAVLKGRKVTLKKQVLHNGSGAYLATVGIDGTAEGTATYSLTIKVLPPVRAKTKGRLRLDPVEPRLDDDPQRSVEGQQVTFSGQNFVSSAETKVFIGSNAAPIASATATSVTVTVPAGVDGTSVPVTVQNPDGQAAVLDDQFVYIPPPTLTDLRDPDDDNFSQRGGAVAGLGVYRVIGENFEAGLTVRFGTADATVLDLTSDTEVRIQTPPGPGGVSSFVNVFVVDRFGREAMSAFLFEYKFAPTFDMDPYTPRLGPTAGGTPIGLSGTNFEVSDTLSIDGQPLNAQFVDATTLRFTSPALAPGSYPVTIIDKYRVNVVGPDFDVKSPPTVTDLLDTGGARVTDEHTTGGTQLRLIGTGFTQNDIVRIGNETFAAQTLLSSTEFALELPSTQQVGPLDITVEDQAAQVATLPFQLTLKRPPTFNATPFAPPFGKIGGGTVITVMGDDFEAADTFRIDGAVVATTFGDANTFTYTTPNLTAGSYATSLEDRLGLVIPGPSLDVKGPPTITGVSVVSGGALTTGAVSRHGGATVRVAGTNFRSDDTVEVDGKSVTTSNVTSTAFEFVTAEAAAAGSQDIVVTDQLQQSVTSANAIDAVGYVDNTSNRLPAGSNTDDLSALRGAIGDLDDDGEVDDLVIVSPPGSSPGSRYEYTRVLFETSGKLIDRTSTNFPYYGADYLGVDYWTATAVGLGDVDGDTYTDIVIADVPPQYYNQTYYGYYYSRNYNGIRMFTNSGAGVFSLDENLGAELIPYEYFTDEYGSQAAYLFKSSIPFAGMGTPTSIGIGDLDGDGNDDVVVGTTSYSAAYWYTYPYYGDPTYYVTFGATADSHYMYSAYYYTYYYYYYGPATKVLINETDLASGAFRDATFERLPVPTGSFGTYAPAFPAHDLKLGDIDKDNDLDIVVSWYDPYSTSPYGLYGKYSTYLTTTNTDVSTRVLVNDGYGFFSDGTGTWMPAGASPEFWQAHRLELVDLDADGDLDMVLLLKQSTDAYQGNTPTLTSSALRILRNDGATTGFVNVTGTAVPTLPTDSDDNFRGTALAVRDVDGDGNLDILVGTTEALQDDDGNDIRRTRLLLGGATAFKFTDGTNFLPLADDDSGEADDILLGDVNTGGELELYLLSETTPLNSASDELARAFDWTK